MRIRTIKPEFWTHPAWARQPDSVRLLALALLNYADDHGYFYADPELIQGQLMPYWESTKVRRTIDDCSSMGWIELIDGPGNYGLLGRIVNFADHQRVDRAKPSKVEGLWDSTKDRRLIDERSTLEQGTGNREQGKEQGTRDVLVDRNTTDPVRSKCPTKEIVLLYNEILGSHLPQAKVKTAARDAAVRRLWNFLKQDKEMVDWFFHEVLASDFLSGRSGKWKKCNLDWLCKTANAVKVIEGNYANEGKETD